MEDLDAFYEYTDKWGFTRRAVLVKKPPKYAFRGINITIAKSYLEKGSRFGDKATDSHWAFDPDTAKNRIIFIRFPTLEELLHYIEKN